MGLDGDHVLNRLVGAADRICVEGNLPLGDSPMVIALSSFAFGISLSPLISLIAGILILIMPRLLNFIVAIYLIIIGLVGVFNL